MAVALQVAAGGAYSEEKAHVTRIGQTSTDVSVGVSADVNGTNFAVTGTAESFLYILTTDATAGSLTITLEHADTIGGTYTTVTDDAVILGGDVETVPTGSLVLDMSQSANQGTILVAVSPSARELLNNDLVSLLKAAHRLNYVTDGSWNGTTVTEIGLEGHKHHMPGPQPA